MFAQKLILASQSPRRAQLLKLVGFDFDIIPSFVDEDEIQEIDPPHHVKSLSLAKAKSVAVNIDKGIIIGADTIVVLNGEILGKPEDKAEAKKMLRRLAGQTHQVYTGFTLLEKPTNRKISDYEITHVHFRVLSDWEIDRYVATQNPMDKAGAYGIQDQSAVFADRIEGCFYNVVGFPLSKFYTAMMEFVSQRPHTKKLR
ncbi:septum formation inhibitor Maf [candidate division KSB1 bacterium]|nr:septum formation inhibitor Maf [candidate division KSB1 bacterium]RQW00434.1 MAG: septum formation inhibitor Maf [candidate division KSB1 bacterium]